LKKKCALALLAFSLCYYHSPTYAAVVITDAAPADEANVNSLTDYTIASGETKTTYNSGSGGTYSKLLIIGGAPGSANPGGGTWRPLDTTSVTTSGGIIINDGSTIDMAYKYSPANGYNGSWHYSSASAQQPTRNLVLRSAQFGDNLTFRINLGTRTTLDGVSSTNSGMSDQIQIQAPSFTAELDAIMASDLDAKANINVEYILNKHFGSRNNTTWTWTTDATDTLYSGKADMVIYIASSNLSVMDRFNVTGDATYDIDGAFTKYAFTSELRHDPLNSAADNTNRKWSVFWTAQKGDALSQGAYSAANASLATRNLWRIEDGLFWQRSDDLRFANRGNAWNDFDHHEGLWTNVWGGEYTFGGIQGSSFKQNYQGIQVGYDKLRARPLRGGKVYTGLFLSQMNSDADFYAQSAGGADYNEGASDLKSYGIGGYMLWQGQKGRYLEGQVRWNRLKNDYTYTDSFGDSYLNEFANKTYGAGIRYGHRLTKDSGFFFEPQVGLSYGVFESFDYTMGNGLRYTQPKSDTLIGRLALSIGKDFGGDVAGERRGQVFFKTGVNHDLLDGGGATMHAMSGGQNSKPLTSYSMDVLGANDTWYDMTLGANLKINPRTNAWLAVNKSFGGDVNTKWQVNGGLSWRFGGPKNGLTATSQGANATQGGAQEARRPLGDWQADAQTEPSQVDVSSVSTTQTENGSEGIAQATTAPLNTPNEVQVNATTTQTQIDGAATTTSGGTSLTGTDGIFTLDTLTVEADRPDWEKNLSPGTVTVVDVPKYAGEHKTFANMLETVPGVYIDRTSGGAGHYTTARIRGSSASQVNIYIDGVLVNTGSEQAVNLENINMDNVQRIEVYRGYIPAKFAGAAMGGAINVVTKRPDKVGGKVSYGIRSFGGQKIGVETTAPLGKGSLMLAYNRDEADGDFTYYRKVTELNQHGQGSLGGVAPQEAFPNKRQRKNNGYENNNLFAKWQDDNWFVKFDYHNNKTERPASASADYVDRPANMYPSFLDTRFNHAIRNATIDTEKLDFSVGRRQTHKNFEWGWKFAASCQEKSTLYTRLDGISVRRTGDTTFKNTAYEAAIDGSWRPSDRHLLEFLASTRRETMKVGFELNDEWSTTWSGMPKLRDYFLPRYELKDHYFQLQDTISLNSDGSLTYTPLVRAQKSEIGIDVQDGASWLYSNSHAVKKTYGNWTLRGTYGSYYKMPSWYEVFGDGVDLQSRWYAFNSIANWSPDIFAEYGTNWDVSVNWAGKVAKTDADITLTYFNRRSENLLTTQFNPLTGATWYVNYGEGKIDGIELSTKLRWNRFDLGFGATWQDSMITKGYTRDMHNTSKASVEGSPFPWTPEVQYNVRLDYRFPKDKLSIFGEYLWTDDINWYNALGDRSYYEAMGLFNVGMKYNFNSKFKMNLGVNDIANKGPKQMARGLQHSVIDTRNVAYPQQGRTYYMTLEYGF